MLQTVVQADLSRTASTSTRLAALEQENSDMKAQIASLNARLAHHAQHAEHLLAGTEAFFGPKAGTIIGQALEEEDSDSNLSFTSAQERSFSRPMSAGSSYSSVLSTSGRSRYNTSTLHTSDSHICTPASILPALNVCCDWVESHDFVVLSGCAKFLSTA